METRAQWTADDIISSAVCASGYALTPYQRDFLADPSPFRAVLKARQTGFSWLFALEALAHAIANRHFSIFVSLNREEAAEKILYARDLYELLPDDSRPRLLRAGTNELRFEGGGRLLSFPCRAPRGRAGASLYLDEMAFYPDSERVYAGALPVVTHGGRVTVSSTPNGDRGMFWRVVSEPDVAANFSQHRAPWWRAPWLCRDVTGAEAEGEQETDARVQRYGTNVLARLRGAMDREAFRQEYEIHFTDANKAFILWEEIEANVRDIPLASTWTELAAMGGPFYAGVDIGRVVHATEIVVLRQVGAQWVVCALKSMVGETYERQEEAVMDCLRIGGVKRVLLDATGGGRQFAERMMRAFPRQAAGLSFTARTKELMAGEVKRALQAGTLILPRDRSLMDQLHTVRRIVNDLGHVRYDAPTEGSSHADKFWALAMALQAATGDAPAVLGRAIIL